MHGDDGLPLKRVDLVGRPHGDIDTPHTHEFTRNTSPDGTTWVGKGDTRESLPEEIPDPLDLP